MSAAPNPHWQFRAALFVRGRATPPVVKLCPQGLHNIYEVGAYHFSQTIKGKRYSGSRCKACNRESMKRAKQRAGV